MKILRCAVLLFCAAAAAAQTTTTITATNFVAGDGVTKIANGRLTFLPTDINGNAIYASLLTGGLMVPRSAICLISNGAITGSLAGGACTVVNTATSNPATFCYQVTLLDTVTNWSPPPLKCVQPSGSTWSFDTYVPSAPTAEVVTGPTGPAGPGCSGPSCTIATPLYAPEIEGTWQADQKQSPSGTGNNGIAQSLTACASYAYACSILAPALYATTESQPWGGLYAAFTSFPTTGPTSAQPKAMVKDDRYGVPQWFFNGSQAYDGRHYMPPSFSMNNIVAPSGVNALITPALQLQTFAYAGGRNTPNNGAVPNGDKTNLSGLQVGVWKYTQTQEDASEANSAWCFGNGDCVGHDIEVFSFGGPNTASDEGHEAMRYFAAQIGEAFTATAGAISTGADGSETIPTTGQANNQTQGEGRLLISITHKYNSGYTSSIATSGGNQTVTCTGCNWNGINGNSTQTALTAAVANAGSTNSFPQISVTLSVASSSGFTAGDLVCVFDYDYECEKATGVGTGTVTLATVRGPHPSGAYVVRGGLTGYCWEAEADRVVPGNTNGIAIPADSSLSNTQRQCIPVMTSTGNTLTLLSGYNQLPGVGSPSYRGRAYTAMGSGGSVTLTVSAGVVTACTASGGSGYGGINAPPQVVIAGTWTTAPTITAYGNGALSGCTVVSGGSGITGTPTATVTPTNAYDVYPACKVWQVYNATSGGVDGTIWTEPCAGNLAAADSIEEPGYFIQRTNGATNGVGQYFPSSSGEPHYGLSYSLNGIWTNDDYALAFVNSANLAVYQGNPSSAPWVLGQGQLIPPQGIHMNGAFANGIYLDTPASGPGQYGYWGSGALMVNCGTPGCSNWNQYSNMLVHWNNNNGQGQDVFAYHPKNQCWYLTAAAAYANGNSPSAYLNFCSTGLSVGGNQVPTETGSLTAGDATQIGSTTSQIVDAGFAQSKVLRNCGTMTTTAAASNTLSCSWVSSSSACTVTPSNSTAVAWTYFSPASGSITVYHASTAGATYSIACSAN